MTEQYCVDFYLFCISEFREHTKPLSLIADVHDDFGETYVRWPYSGKSPRHFYVFEKSNFVQLQGMEFISYFYQNWKQCDSDSLVNIICKQSGMT